ncbi:hypothetical protein Aph01nite_74120 [Acrocarpospora phusangensis]|uniref:Uncharacterized protein n=1 Tax=Acrocarpospora phusangensis TaxID=1070424 RepID=A0A919USE4_9ACTN|nr:hypothetical protein [Acrocarpospora phusangensis]GIH29102.1 hypothetical protein Aph01nite_74120 [Acrocarpospora phusangensis]
MDHAELPAEVRLVPVTDPGMAAAVTGLATGVSDVRRLVEVGFTRTDGQLLLVIQRLDHSDQRHAQLEGRVDKIDQAREGYVTKAEAEAARKRLLTIIGLMLTAATVLLGLAALLTRT